MNTIHNQSVTSGRNDRGAQDIKHTLGIFYRFSCVMQNPPYNYKSISFQSIFIATYMYNVIRAMQQFRLM